MIFSYMELLQQCAAHALTFAHSFGFRDYCLIKEIIEEAEDLDLGETAKDILTMLNTVKRD